jgi:hypothetical protein
MSAAWLCGPAFIAWARTVLSEVVLAEVLARSALRDRIVGDADTD